MKERKESVPPAAMADNFSIILNQITKDTIFSSFIWIVTRFERKEFVCPTPFFWCFITFYNLKKENLRKVICPNNSFVTKVMCNHRQQHVCRVIFPHHKGQ